MRKYENQVQLIKSNVLTEVARYAFKGNLEDMLSSIPLIVNPGPDEKYRCCIFHERAITADRVKLALGGDTKIPGIIEVLESACDQCPVNRYVVTETCRGCLAHRCQISCPANAITIVKGKAHIDYDLCIECGKCKESCPYNAIADVMRPCKRECPVGAIQIDFRKKAVIDYDKCISCGACVYHCPFGAIQDKSQIIPVIEALKGNTKNVYAMLAPAFATQFDYVDLGKVIHGLKNMGFRDVVEVALGADWVTEHEANELLHFKSNQKVMTSSCCPGFVSYINQKYPELKDHVSKTVSPMTATARWIKSIDPVAIVVFIGPCIAKKNERLRAQETDYVLTFEELASMIDASEIDLITLEPSPLNNASAYGRRFASTGGVSSAVMHMIPDSPITVEICDGISACDKALKLLKYNRLNADFIEGMACKGGCIKGPATMHHGPKDLKAIDAYAKIAIEPTASEALRIFKSHAISLE